MAIGILTLVTACGGAGTAEEVIPGGAASNGSGAGASGQDGTGGDDTGGGDTEAGGSGAGGESAGTCAAAPACDAKPPKDLYGPKLPWNHDDLSGDPNHRGRDLFFNPGDPQWIIAKFAYGEVFNSFLVDNDLEDEQVDIYLLRDCGTEWEFLGSALTSDDNWLDQGPNETVEGVDDDGGRVYFKIPADKELGPGRHRVHFVVRGDLSTTDLFIEVVPPHAPVFVSDVDGTLTDTEYAEFTALWSEALPGVHPDAAAAFQILAGKGYRPVYLTARPEWLTGRTRELLDANGFPPGIVHTTLTSTGAIGGSAVDYKSEELAMLAAKGLMPSFAFGNTDSDAEAYEDAGIEEVTRFFYQFDPATFGGKQIQSYTELLGELEELPTVCQ